MSPPPHDAGDDDYRLSRLPTRYQYGNSTAMPAGAAAASAAPAGGPVAPPRSRSATPSSSSSQYYHTQYANRPNNNSQYHPPPLPRNAAGIAASYSDLDLSSFPPVAGPPPRSALPLPPGPPPTVSLPPTPSASPSPPRGAAGAQPKNSTLLRTVDTLLADLEDCMNDFADENVSPTERPIHHSQQQYQQQQYQQQQQQYQQQQYQYQQQQEYQRSAPPPSVVAAEAAPTAYIRNPRSFDLPRPMPGQPGDRNSHSSLLRPARSSARSSVLSDTVRHSVLSMGSSSSRASFIGHRRGSSAASSFIPTPSISSSGLGGLGGGGGGSGGGGSGGGAGAFSSVFTSQKTLGTLSSYPGAKTGYMSKHSPGRLFQKAWKKRFYCLANNKLWVFHSADPDQKAASFLQITRNTGVRVGETGVGVLEVTGEDYLGDGVMIPKTKVEIVWELQCKDMADMMDWLAALRKCVDDLAAAKEEERAGRERRRATARSDERSRSRHRSLHAAEADRASRASRGSGHSGGSGGAGNNGSTHRRPQQPATPSLMSPVLSQHAAEHQHGSAGGPADYFDPRFHDYGIPASQQNGNGGAYNHQHSVDAGVPVTVTAPPHTDDIESKSPKKVAPGGGFINFGVMLAM
ncbi:hypothetical protein HDU86_008442 [Geranomyces michiganensis]|nr:hypothetical protein HDU86_008442 [Geranomyces michiganensis]